MMMKAILGAAAGVAVLAAFLPMAGATPDPGTIPASLQGRWALTSAECDMPRADAPGLMEIGPGGVKFSDARGKLRRAIISEPGRLEADFDLASNGRTWERRMILEADGAGTLTRQDFGDGAPRTSLDYRACSKA